MEQVAVESAQREHQPQQRDRSRRRGLQALMERYIDGDQRAFMKLHAALQPRVRSRLSRMVRDEALVEDLVQQTFMRAHQARARYQAGPGAADRAVEGWFLAIARNVALDSMRHQYRRDRRHATLEARGEVEGMGVPAETPNSEAVHIEREREEAQVARVRAAIDQLPPSQREVVKMHKLRGMPMADIADRLGVRPGALRVRAHRAYKALARMLEPNTVATPA
ncbi:MAG: RNA polymerase sigma factor [Myxococcota bacterium]